MQKVCFMKPVSLQLLLRLSAAVWCDGAAWFDPPQPSGSSLTNTPFITCTPPLPPHGRLTSSESEMKTAGAAPDPAHQTASVVMKSILISDIKPFLHLGGCSDEWWWNPFLLWTVQSRPADDNVAAAIVNFWHSPELSCALLHHERRLIVEL